MAADVYVWAECPRCSAVWLQAIVTRGAWWAPADPLSCLKVPHCPACKRKPPMLDAKR